MYEDFEMDASPIDEMLQYYSRVRMYQILCTSILATYLRNIDQFGDPDFSAFMTNETQKCDILPLLELILQNGVNVKYKRYQKSIREGILRHCGHQSSLVEISSAANILYQDRCSLFHNCRNNETIEEVNALYNSATKLLLILGVPESDISSQRLRALHAQHLSHMKRKLPQTLDDNHSDDSDVCRNLTENLDEFMNRVEVFVVDMHCLSEGEPASHTLLISRLCRISDDLLSMFEKESATGNFEMSERLRDLRHKVEAAIHADQTQLSVGGNGLARLQGIKTIVNRAKDILRALQDEMAALEETVTSPGEIQGRKSRDSTKEEKAKIATIARCSQLIKQLQTNISKLVYQLESLSKPSDSIFSSVRHCPLDIRFILHVHFPDGQNLFGLIFRSKNRPILKCVCENWYERDAKKQRLLELHDAELWTSKSFRAGGFKAQDLLGAGLNATDLR